MKAKLAFLFVILFLLAGSLQAQTAPPVPPQPGTPPVPPRGALGPAHDPIGENLFPPELIMAHQRALGLSEEQRTYLREEMRKAQSRFAELQWQLQDAVEALGAVLGPDQVPESQALAQLERVLEAERQIKQLQITLMVRVKNRLTPEQQARLRELRPRPGQD